MRHRNAGWKLKREPQHRQMLLRNLATDLLDHGKITTTLAKAKAVQPFVEKLITEARDGFDLNRFRRCLAVVTRKDICFKLFHVIGPQFKDRDGGYTRIYRLAKLRQGDASQMAIITLIGADEKPESQKSSTRPAVVPSTT
jgi:large subunit ribosomal protein L17